jgi:hypothetical protein
MSPEDTPQLFNFVDVWKDNVGRPRSFQIVNDKQHLSKIAQAKPWSGAAENCGRIPTQ